MKGLFVGQRQSDFDLHPNGVTQWSAARIVGNPFGVQVHDQFVTQGALADSRPWALLGNPFGVQESLP